MATDEELASAAAQAAQDVVFSRFDVSEVADLDVSVSVEEGAFEVDVYVHAPDGRADERRVAEDAAMAAQAAVEEHLDAA